MDPKLLTGTVDMLLLDVLARGDSYGYQITQDVLERSGGAFELKEGSLYPALHRLERRRHVQSYWVDDRDRRSERRAPEGRRRKYYRLTATGRRALEAKRREWERFTAGVESVLGVRHGMA
jgi:PadR family transcriptional regulator PadR